MSFVSGSDQPSSPPLPKSRLKKWSLRLFLVLVVLGLIGFTGFTTFMKIKFADFQPPMAPANVVVSVVTKHNFADRIEAIGTAKSDESATITATVTEKVVAIPAEDGAFLHAGDVIVELTSDEERATLFEAKKAYDRYNRLAETNIGSQARKDEEEARMNVARAQLDKRQIVAPFDGVLGIRRVSIGDLVTPGTVITTIDDVDPMELEFSVPETFLSVLSTELPITARTEAWPDEEFTGTIIAVDTRIDPDTRAIRIKAAIPNPDARLRSGLLMRVNIVRNARTALAVPEEALVATGDKKSVLIVGEGNKIESRDVVTGLRQIGYVEVLEGLSGGEKVVIEGQMKAQPGSEVKILGEKTIPEAVDSAVKYSVPRKKEALEKEISPLAPEENQ